MVFFLSLHSVQRSYLGEATLLQSSSKGGTKPNTLREEAATRKLCYLPLLIFFLILPHYLHLVLVFPSSPILISSFISSLLHSSTSPSFVSHLLPYSSPHHLPSWFSPHQPLISSLHQYFTSFPSFFPLRCFRFLHLFPFLISPHHLLPRSSLHHPSPLSLSSASFLILPAHLPSVSLLPLFSLPSFLILFSSSPLLLF